MSILQEYEMIRREIGEDEFHLIEEYLEWHPDKLLSDVYYNESTYKDFEEWKNNRPEITEFKMKVKMDLVVTKEDIEDIIDTAGYGIGYWAHKAVVGKDTYTITDDEGTYVLTYKDIVRGIKFYIDDNNSQNIVEYRDGNMVVGSCYIDSEIADMIIQYACFGEIIYG